MNVNMKKQPNMPATGNNLPFEREYLVSNGVFARESVFIFENYRAIYRDWQIHVPMVLPRRSAQGLLKMQFELKEARFFVVNYPDRMW